MDSSILVSDSELLAAQANLKAAEDALAQAQRHRADLVRRAYNSGHGRKQTEIAKVLDLPPVERGPHGETFGIPQRCPGGTRNFRDTTPSRRT